MRELKKDGCTPLCKGCKRELQETPSCYFVCPWCQTKLYDPIDIAAMARLDGLVELQW